MSPTAGREPRGSKGAGARPLTAAHVRPVLTVLAALALLLPEAAGRAPLRICYTLTPVPPRGTQAARTEVEVRIDGLAGDLPVRLQMPAWSPGDYHVQNHAQYVRGLRAESADGRGLDATHPDANTWEVPASASPGIVIRYSLPNTPPGYFSENVQVRARCAFYNGPATYLYVVGHKQDPATVRVVLPSGWKSVVVPLPPAVPPTGGAPSAAFAAPDYDTLADSPVLAGDCATRTFTEGGRPHTIAFFGDHEGMDYDAYVPPTQRIVAAEQRLMGGAPYRRYVVFLDVGGRGGGLEHLDSCRIAWGRDYPAAFYAPFVAHEFYHLWNVKRIRPEVLGPFDYVHPPRTRSLWFCEGVTQYYADLAMRRSGLWDEAALLAELGRSITALQRSDARLRVTADEASLRVWEGGGSEGYGGLSYYLKGELIGLCLDLKLRRVTDGRASLDTVMRALLTRFGPPRPGYPEDGIRDALTDAGGTEMEPFYDLLCRTTREMPFAQCLGYAGLSLRRENDVWRIVPDPAADQKAISLRQTWNK